MSITINGTGTITGISAGGLPDDCIVTNDIAAGAVTDAKITGAITDAKLSGTTCKAWVNFNGTGTVAIRASYNVSSITDNGTGDYTINFTNALPDSDYAFVAISREDNSGGFGDHSTYLQRVESYSTAGSMRFRTGSTANYADHIRVMAAIFR